MSDDLSNKARRLEDLFFAQKDAELIEKRKQLEKMKRDRDTLSAISGITDEAVLDKFMELEVSPEVMASMTVIPLVEVAWADGKLDEEERKAVLAGAVEARIAKGSVKLELLGEWLKQRPPRKMLRAWAHYVSGLCGSLGAKEREALKRDMMRQTRKVAEASGGFLGVMKISPEEEAVLKELEKAFEPCG